MQNSMRVYKNRGVRALLVIASVVATFAVGCNTDYGLGGDYLPSGQQMQTFNKELLDGVSEGSTRGDATASLFAASLTKSSDSINGFNQTQGYFGLQRDTKFGTRRSGFFTQYTPAYALDEDGFGAGEVTLDSIFVYFAVASYSGDTTSTQKYAIYQVLDDSFITDSVDSLFLVNDAASLFKQSEVLSAEPILTFDYPDIANNVPAVSTSSTVRFAVDDSRITATGSALFKKLALQEEDSDIDYTIYGNDFTEFIGEFKGFYIIPVNGVDTAVSGEGGTYGATLSSSGLGLKFTNSVVETDDDGEESEVDYSVTMNYVFRDTYFITDIGGSSIATVERGTDWIGNSVVEDASVTEFYVEGMGGVVSELTIQPAMFAQFDAWIAEVEDQTGVAGNFDHIFINKARLRIYLDDNADMNAMMTRLGMYRNYTNLLDDDGNSRIVFVNDYDYVSEASTGTASAYGGFLNRSNICYEISLQLELQEMYSNYLELKTEANGDATQIDWSDVTWNRLIIAPISTSMFDPKYSTMQCSTTKPIAFNITYTVMKR